MTFVTPLEAPAEVHPGLGTQPVSAAPDTAPAPVVWYRRRALQQRLRLFARLVQMSPAEVLHRLQRAVLKRSARARAQRHTPAVERAAAAVRLPRVLADDPLAHLRRRATRGFFDLDQRDRLVTYARARCAPDVARTVRAADAILGDGIALLGRHFRPAAPDFDWLADPTLGRVWPFTVLDDADAVRRVRADVKFVWEVNRHQFFATLARAYLYTGEARYADAVVAMARRWIAANPPGVGVNWASNLEVAVRALSWVWALQFLVGAAALTAEDLRLWLASLLTHRDHLARHLSTYTDPTNHLIGESAALAVLSIWLPELEGGAPLQRLALTTLARELERQVAADGVDREQAMSYQRFVLDFALQVVAIAARNHVALPAVIRGRTAAMLGAIRELVGTHGRAPRLGDGDDARGLPFGAADFWDFGEVLAAGSAVLDGDPDSAHRSESALWLGGVVPVAEPPRARRPPARASTVLAEGGYAVLRPPGQPLDRLVFDCGPLGYPPHGSHGHADLLGILVDVGGEEVLVDPGTFAYYGESGWRAYFRSTRAHNTVEVGGRDQADAFDPFKWLNWPRRALAARHLEPGFDYVEAWHDGYRRLRPAVRHRRAVVGLRGGWLVIDWFEGRGQHDAARWFHAAPLVQVEPLDAGAVRLWTPSRRHALVLRDFAGPGESPTAARIGMGPYSERYGSLTAAPTVHFGERLHLPAIRVTGLVTEHHGEPALQLAAAAGRRDAGGLSLRLTDASGARIAVAVRTPTAATQVGPLHTDARAAIVRTGGAGPAAFRSGGSFVERRHD